MEKLYLNKDVYTAAQERLKYIFDNFENVCVSFSGGKDSGLVLNLVLDYVRKNGITRRIGLFHQDFEAQYQATTDYVDRTFANVPDFVDRYWCCFPMSVENSVSVYEPFWVTWDEDKKDLWCRNRPSYPYCYSLDNNPFSEWYEQNMLEEKFYAGFNQWYHRKCGSGKTVFLLGIRSDESLLRYRSIVKKVHMYGDQMWTHDLGDGCYSATPIYDWTVDDVWTANGKFGFDYNRLYDLLYKAGIPLSKMRVASPFLSEGRSGLNTYRIIDPAMWAKLVGRVNGANFGAICGNTRAFATRDIKLPEGHTWETYTKYLLSTLPDGTRENYERIFSVSMEFWRETGGGMGDDVIEEVKEKGYAFKENGYSPYSRGRSKKRLIIDEIPDDTDDILSTVDLPSWKRMCMCILRNDYTCKSMGFAPTKEQQIRINALKDKYRKIMRGEKDV